jgi:hypothetical protein
LNHYAAPDFWSCHRELPASTRDLADRLFALLKADPTHPSLHLKRVGRYWSVRVGRHYRAVAVEVAGGLLWFWVGTHAEYDRLIG